MAYDERLAARIRALLGEAPDITEKKMFGGLAFLVHGNMAIAASGEGGILVRVDPARTDELVATTDAHVAEMRGRLMPGWLRVEADRLEGDGELGFWVRTGTDFARSLPTKN
jgi:TfoX/Sxy family transcriptional regulator of competence genes